MAKRKKEEEQRESIVDIVKLLAKERDIEEEEIFKAIESGIVAAYRREPSPTARKSSRSSRIVSSAEQP